MNKFIHFIVIACILGTSCRKVVITTPESASSVTYLTGSNNDKVQMVEPTKDGGFIYCGLTLTNVHDAQAFMMKVDANGNQEWYHTYGDSSYNRFVDAIQCSDGGYVAVGSKGMTALPGSWITSDIDYVVKTDANGKEEWSKSFTEADLAICELTGVAESGDHFIYAVGYYPGVTHWQDLLIMKFDLKGNLAYYKGVQADISYPPHLISDADISQAFGMGITIAKTGDVLISGEVNPWASPGSLPINIPAVVKLKPGGSVDFYYPYFNHSVASSYTAAFQKKQVMKVISVDDANYICWNHDTTVSGGPRQCIELIKTDLNGNPLWDRTYFCSGNAVIHNMNRMHDGSLLIYGGTSRDLLDISFPEGFRYINPFFMKVNTSGNISYQAVVGTGLNASLFKCINLTPDGDFTAGGYTSINDQGYDKLFFCKMTQNGKLK